MPKAQKIILFLLLMCFLHKAEAQQFVANLGQWDAPFEYKLQWQSAAVYLRTDGLRFHLQDPRVFKHMHNESGQHELPTGLVKNHVFDVLFNGTAKAISPQKKQAAYHNYYVGKDQKRWKSEVPLYEEIRYEGLYNGIDLLLKSSAENLKYDLIVAAGVDVSQINWRYVGADGLHLLEGKLLIETSLGPILEEAPIAWQIIDGTSIVVEVAFSVKENSVGFTVGEYNKNYPLIIDPNYIFSTFTGSIADNFGYTATYDALGNSYGGGIVFGNGYPTSIGAFEEFFAGGIIDASISKFSPNGVQLLYSTYLGGSQPDQPHSMVVDGNGDLIVLGITGSANFPVTPTAFDTSFNGGPNANVSFMPFGQGVDLFIAKFNSAGTNLLASTFLGGSGTDGANLGIVRNYGDQARGEVIEATNGDIYFVSSSNSPNFPANGTGIYLDTLQGAQDAILGRLNSSLTTLHWSQYLGGTGDDAGYSIKLNSTQTVVYAAGGTESSDFPIAATPAYQGVFGGGIVDGWIASYTAQTGAILNTTYNGTASYDQNFFVALDADDDVYVCGQTKGIYPVSPNVYTVPGSAQFIQKFNAALTLSKKSMLFGDGSNATIDISPTALMVDACKSVYISGWGGNVNNEGTTNGLPFTKDAQDSVTDGSDFYFLVLNGSWQFLEYATYFGGPGAEHVDGGTSRFSPEGVIHQAVCAGCGGQSSFPTFPSNVYSQVNNSANCNLGLVKIDFDLQNAVVDVVLGLDSVCVNDKLAFADSSRNLDVMYWDFGDGTSYTGRNPIKYFDTTGTFIITIIGIDTLCNTSDTSVLSLTVFDSFSQSAFTLDFDTCGLPFQVMLNNLSVGAIAYLWDFGDGTTSTKVNPAKTYGQEGIFTISLAAKDSICDNWDTTYQTVVFRNSGGQVGFTTTYNECSDWQEVKVLPSNGNNYHVFTWDFGDGTSSNTKFPTHLYTQPGTYTIQLVAYDSICKLRSIAVQTISILYYEAVHDVFPNIFTPNADGVNDTWQIVENLSASQFVDFKVEVYNRWGGLVLTNYDPAYKWRGNYLEEDLPDGVYMWLVWYTDICGNQEQEKGQVTIMR